jgi:hypothetical protein
VRTVNATAATAATTSGGSSACASNASASRSRSCSPSAAHGNSDDRATAEASATLPHALSSLTAIATERGVRGSVGGISVFAFRTESFAGEAGSRRSA